MAALSIQSKIAVVGAGTMGAGIAQVAATAGHSVLLVDIAAGVAQAGKASVQAGLEALVKRGKKTQQEVDAIMTRIHPTQNLAEMHGCALIIEAIIEDVQIKQSLFAELESLCAKDTIIASNTSSISISALSAKAQNPERIVGIHFFNPAAILKLVEVVSGLRTAPKIAQTIYDTAHAWGKKPVHTKSTPGFIVNRVARPFYAEALRSLQEQVSSVATIDALMRSCGGFKMGPLELTDLIGQDVNCAVTESVYNAFYQDTRFLPSVLQADMVSAGLLGRKSGQGFYDYGGQMPEADVHAAVDADVQKKVKVVGTLQLMDTLLESIKNTKAYTLEHNEADLARIEIGEAILQITDGRTATQRAAEQGTPNLALLDYAVDYRSTDLVAIAFAQQASEQAKVDAIHFLQTLGKQVCVIKDVPGLQVLRTVAMLVNEAFDAVNQGVCDADAVDIAMQAGVAYPQGPIAWGRDIGLQYLVLVLSNMQQAYTEERYRVSPLLLIEQYT